MFRTLLDPPLLTSRKLSTPTPCSLMFPSQRPTTSIHSAIRTLVCPFCRTVSAHSLWNRSAEVMMLHLGESGHPFFLRPTSALDRGFLKSKKGGKLSIHCTGDLSNAELFRTVISVNRAQCLRSDLGLV